MEDVIPAVSVERTEEGQADSAISRDHDEVIGFLLQVSLSKVLDIRACAAKTIVDWQT